MQIFSRSYNDFSSGREKLYTGFSLVELLISVGIISVIVTMVLVRYATFDSTVLLKGEAYEIALLLREAQVKSVSVSGINSNFDYPYGMSFTSGSSVYQGYVYKSGESDPLYDVCAGGEEDNCAETTYVSELNTSMIIDDICYELDDEIEVCGEVDRVDVSFRRPEFDGLFYVVPDDEGVDPDEIIFARIILASSRPGAGSGRFIVEVSKRGQISVYKED